MRKTCPDLQKHLDTLLTVNSRRVRGDFMEMFKWNITCYHDKATSWQFHFSHADDARGKR